MSAYQFGPWEPDSAGVDSGVLATAKNVWPTKEGYAPIPNLAAFSTSALSEKCVGIFAGRASSGGWIIFAGTPTKLYRFQSNAWVDYTRASGGAYAVPNDDYWSFTQFGSYVLAVNIADDPQYIDVDAGTTAFALLAGSPPRARYVSTVGDFVVLASLSSNDRKVRNSAINSAVGWTVGTNLCDEQEFPDGGRVTGLKGGEFGYVGQERSIRRMIFQPGSDIAFRYERVDEERGPAAGYSMAGTANSIFFLANDGFYAFGAGGLVPIAAQKVNKWFRSNGDASRYYAVVAFNDPFAPRVCWAFYSSSGSTNFDRVIIYDWQLNRWSYAEIEAQYWASIVTPGLTLEDLDIYGSIDTGVPYPLDSRVWEGGAPVIGAVNASGQLAFLESATSLDAVLSTCPLHVSDGARSKEFEIEPLGVFNGATLALRIGKRENTQNAASYTASASPSSLTGMFRLTAAGRMHDFELTITQSSGVPWTQAQGLGINRASRAGRK